MLGNNVAAAVDSCAPDSCRSTPTRGTYTYTAAHAHVSNDKKLSASERGIPAPKKPHVIARQHHGLVATELQIACGYRPSILILLVVTKKMFDDLDPREVGQIVKRSNRPRIETIFYTLC